MNSEYWILFVSGSGIVELWNCGLARRGGWRNSELRKFWKLLISLHEIWVRQIWPKRPFLQGKTLEKQTKKQILSKKWVPPDRQRSGGTPEKCSFKGPLPFETAFFRGPGKIFESVGIHFLLKICFFVCFANVFPCENGRFGQVCRTRIFKKSGGQFFSYKNEELAAPKMGF